MELKQILTGIVIFLIICFGVMACTNAPYTGFDGGLDVPDDAIDNCGPGGLGC